ncbi:hypothetical protein GCM10010211_01000 [Streptomyces albospinus]|uniref:Uncharacterized protein n=1 Tax=Streptomyces albospinus TaxID=285515 RepID=A0ABQ2UKI7_9ACTN|nr:hypothetical protein GCM10010211_01000 [Streptomyces albospinus]
MRADSYRPGRREAELGSCGPPPHESAGKVAANGSVGLPNPARPPAYSIAASGRTIAYRLN